MTKTVVLKFKHHGAIQGHAGSVHRETMKHPQRGRGDFLEESSTVMKDVKSGDLKAKEWGRDVVHLLLDIRNHRKLAETE